MNTGSVLFPSSSPVSSRPSSTVSSYDDYSNYSFSNDLPHRHARPPANGRLSYPHQPFPLNPSPRHYLYPPYAQNPPPPLRPSTMPPPPMFDDPAFSSDPRANPHFAMTSTEQFVPLNTSAATIQNTTLPSQDALYRHSRDGSARAQDISTRHSHKITSATPPRLQPRADSAYYPDDAFAFQSVPQPPPSMPKLSKRHRIGPDSHLRHNNLLQPHDYINDNSSNSSCSSSSHSTSSGASSVLLTPSSSPPAPRPSKLRARLRVVNPEDDDRPIPVFPLPEYTYEPKQPFTHVLGGDRPPLLQNTSAPELCPPPAAPVTDVPPRPVTVPVQPLPGSTIHSNLPTKEPSDPKPSNTSRPLAPEMRKQRSRKTSIAAPPKDLDRIDELDETDPLGYAWHHDGRFEAALNALKQGAFGDGDGANGGASSQEQNGKKSSRKKPSEPVNPNTTTFNISPGEIFPSFVSQPATQPAAPQQQQQQFPQPIQRPSRQASQPASQPLPPTSQPPLRPSRSQSRLRAPQPQAQVQDQPIPSSLIPGGPNHAVSRLEANGPTMSQQSVQQLQVPILSQPQPTRTRPNSQYLTVPTTNPIGDGDNEESELAYTLPSPSRTPVPNMAEQQQQAQAQAQMQNQNQNPYFPVIPGQPPQQQPQKHHHNRLRRHEMPVPGPEQAGLAPFPPAGSQNYPAPPGTRVRFQDQRQQQAGYDNNFLSSDLQDPRFPARRMPSPQPNTGLNQPFLQPQDENMNVGLGNGNYRNPGLQRSTSAPHATPRSQPPGLPPPQPEDLYMMSQERLDLQQQQIPRPDIPLPPRHAAGNMKPGLMPSYLPKKLVMPTPLQSQPPTTRPSGMGLYGESANSASSGSSGSTVDLNGRSYGHGQSLSVSAVTPKKAKEIPISQGRNLLRKRTTIGNAPVPPTTAAMQTISLDDPLPGPLGPGMGKNGYVPSSNATAALFATKGSVENVPVPVNGNGNGFGGDVMGMGRGTGMGLAGGMAMGMGGGMAVGVGVIGGEMRDARDAKKSSREREKEEKLRAKELEKMRERESQKPTGRKLSKRR
ncbi:hypothetical protein QCA50_002185 [Cerrena zonata]|uniref:Uncharacterized protein n=1 Tax=Cerrena zonata TaxID=2478898 RepID=A0AAW0GSR8_9APHY